MFDLFLFIYIFSKVYHDNENRKTVMLENTEKQTVRINFWRGQQSLCDRLGKLNIMHAFYWMQLMTYVVAIVLRFLFLFQKKEWPLLLMKLRLEMNSLKVHQLQI